MNLKNRKLRFALFLTAVLLVFFGALWLIFSKPTAADEKAGPGGLNLLLPAAAPGSDSGKNKLDYYAFALTDSLKKKEDSSLDPYRKDSTAATVAGVQDKVAEIRTLLRRQVRAAQIDRAVSTDLSHEKSIATQPAVVASISDPEMAAINATLDKIAALQHPAQRSTEPSTFNEEERVVYATSEGAPADATFFGRHAGTASPARFFGPSFQSVSTRGIRARIAGEQQVQSGSTVKMELLTAISVRGINISAGTFLFGIAYLDGERLRVQVPSIRSENFILPVALQVFDLDGLEGIFIPGSLPRDVMKESAEQAIQAAGLAGGFTLAGKVASAGLGVAKNLFSKKLKQVRVTLSSGYQVLLKDKHQNELQ